MRCAADFLNSFKCSWLCPLFLIYRKEVIFTASMENSSLALLKLLLPPDANETDERLNAFLEAAENTILDYIGRDILPERLYDVKAQLALIMYNRLGTEGESRRTEGEITSQYIDGLPAEIKGRLKNYPRKVGVINAADTETT